MRKDIDSLSNTLALPAHFAGHEHTRVSALHTDSTAGLFIHALAILHIRLVLIMQGSDPRAIQVVLEKVYLSALESA